jgi:mannose-6-phosphate isomerase-like protein (cupin superfamily)
MKTIRVALADAAARLSAEHPFESFFEERDEILVELYAPVGVDRQTPHDRDELYIVVEGTGSFIRDGERTHFAPGDLLYVPAHVSHHFEFFSEGFTCWVIFYGPKRNQPAART